MRRALSLALTFLFLTNVAWAAEIRVVTANPLHEGLVRAAEQFKRDTGHDVKVQAATTAELNKILSVPDSAEILVGTAAMVDQALKEGKVAEGRTPVGRVGVAVVVRRGARVPDVATSDAMKRAALAADSVVYNTAGSGQIVQRMFEQLGIVEQVRPRSVRPPNAAETMDWLIKARGNEIGFGLLSEIKPYEAKGIQVVGSLPHAFQSFTNYDAVVFAGASSAAVANDFIRYLTTPQARKLFAATGVN
jgi:molybdate transport system substrate-binding protein